MDNEMIERCRFAVIEQIQKMNIIAGTHINSKAIVIAVIKAMREPTEKMLNAEGVYTKCHMCGGHEEGYQLMIGCIIND